MINQTIAGYRVIRTVAESPRAHLLLAQAVGGGDAQTAPIPVLLKLYRSTVPAASIHAECDALTRVSSSHLATVIDVGSNTDGAGVVVVEWIAGASLSKLIKDRQSISVGEAITILVPLAETLTTLHHHGVAHGALGVDSVILRDTGCPVLVGFDSASCQEGEQSPAKLSKDSLVRADIIGFTRLVNTLLALVRAERSVHSQIQQLSESNSCEEVAANPFWARDLEACLFSLGSPEPVRFCDESSASLFGERVGARVSLETVEIDDSADVVESWADSVGLPNWLRASLGGALRSFRRGLAQSVLAVRLWLAPVRLRVWLLGAAALGAIVLAFIATVGPSSSSSGPTDTAATPRVSSSSGSLREGVASDNNLSGLEVPTAVDSTGALSSLLSERDQCFRDLSVDCLLGVENEGSPAYASDVEAIRLIVAGEEVAGVLRLVDAEVTAVQELGASVLFTVVSRANSEPASILLVKGEAGWRIRSISVPE